MDANEVKMPLEKAIRAHGVLLLCRETGLSYSTVRAVMKGLQMPTTATAEKIVDALGLELGEIIWPKGFGDAHAERLYSQEQFKAAVERRAAELVALARQSMGEERTAAQSNESNVT